MEMWFAILIYEFFEAKYEGPLSPTFTLRNPKDFPHDFIHIPMPSPYFQIRVPGHVPVI